MSNQNLLKKMKERFNSEVVNGATTKKKYVSPEIEVINLDEQPKLLAGSYTGTAGWGGAGLSEEDGD